MTQMTFETLWPQPNFKEVVERIRRQYGVLWKIDGVEIRIWGGELETLVNVSQSAEEYHDTCPPHERLEVLWNSQLIQMDARMEQDGQ